MKLTQVLEEITKSSQNYTELLKNWNGASKKTRAVGLLAKMILTDEIAQTIYSMHTLMFWIS